MDKLKNFEIEYKRRFLIEKIPNSIDLTNLNNTPIKLSYLSKESDSLEIECESIYDSYFNLNIRDTGYIKRNKIIIPLDDEATEVISHLSNPKMLDITRYEYIIENKIIYIIKYNNLNIDYLIAEYIDDEKFVKDFKPLNWMKEITNDFKYNNIMLSINRGIIK